MDVTDSLTMKPSGWQLSPCEELHERHQGQRDLHRPPPPDRSQGFQAFRKLRWLAGRGGEQDGDAEVRLGGEGGGDAGPGGQDRLQAVRHTQGEQQLKMDLG